MKAKPIPATTRIFLLLVTFALNCRGKDDLPRWERISYSRVPSPWGGEGPVYFSVGSGVGDDKARFRVDIMWCSAADDPATKSLPDPKDVTMLLHNGDATTVSHFKSPKNWGGVGGGGGSTWSLIYTFPWGKNTLDEAWVEIQFPAHTVWLKVPYGFTRDPRSPMPPPEPAKGAPSLLPAMKKMPDSDCIVSWTAVSYDLGEIQHGWRLSLSLSNPVDARCELTVYRDPVAIGKGMYLLDAKTPRTSVAIQEPGENELTSSCAGTRNPEDGMRRIDTFKFNRYPHSGRGWGDTSATVDQKACHVMVPSSLFKYLHGRASEPVEQRISEDAK